MMEECIACMWEGSTAMMCVVIDVCCGCSDEEECWNALHDCEKERIWWWMMWCDDAGLMCAMGAGWRGTDVRDVVRCGAMWCDDAGLIAIDYSVNGLILNNYKWVQLMGWINLNISQLRCCKTWKMLEECIAWLWEDECDDVCCDWCVLWLLWWRRMCAMVCMIVRWREYEHEWWGRQLAQ